MADHNSAASERFNMSVKVKICGITNIADGLCAAEAGADALGFVFADKSGRQLTFQAAADIIRELPPFVMKVGVFVNATEDDVLRAIETCGLNLLQFHGDESPEYCFQFGLMTMKAFRLRDAQSLEQMERFNTQAWLLEAWSPASYGGKGDKFDWQLAVRARAFGRPIFLAGGLNAGNVAEAIRVVQPYAVDVSSGVEAEPRRKDHSKIKEFISAVKNASVES